MSINQKDVSNFVRDNIPPGWECSEMTSAEWERIFNAFLEELVYSELEELRLRREIERAHLNLEDATHPTDVVKHNRDSDKRKDLNDRLRCLYEELDYLLNN